MVTRARSALRLPSRAIALYLAATTLVGFSIDGGIYAVLLNLYLLRLGYGPEQIGMVNSAGLLVFAISSLPAGSFGERWGSRRMLFVGMGLTGAGALLMPLADTLEPALRLPWLLSQAALLYFGLALYFVNTAPFVMGAVHPEDRSRIFSLQTALISLSTFVGSLAGGFLPILIAWLLVVPPEAPAPYRYALMLAALALLPAMLAIHRARPAATAASTTAPDAPAKPAQPNPPVLRLLIDMALVRLLQIAGLASVVTFFNVYLDSELLIPTTQIGAIIALGRLLGVPAALATAPLTRRFGGPNVVMWSSAGTALAVLPIVLIPHWSAAGLTFIGVTCLSWIRYASSLVFFLERVPPARRPLVSGVTEMAAGICFTLVTFGGGYMIAQFGYRMLFLAGALLTGLGVLAFWWLFARSTSGGHTIEEMAP